MRQPKNQEAAGGSREQTPLPVEKAELLLPKFFPPSALWAGGGEDDGGQACDGRVDPEEPTENMLEGDRSALTLSDKEPTISSSRSQLAYRPPLAQADFQRPPYCPLQQEGAAPGRRESHRV
jgi:hypothetical protein